MPNKKIKNAEEVIYNGIKFRSRSELKAYKTLFENGLNPSYETEHFVLWDGFTPQKPFVKNGEEQLTKKGLPKKFGDWKYTPDFVVELNEHKFYIEYKGFPNDLWPYKLKMFLKLIDNNEKIHFFEVNNEKGLIKTIEKIKNYGNN